MGNNVSEDRNSERVEDWRTQDWSKLPPAERLVTMPQGLPERTLGYGVIRWIGDNLVHPDGDREGKPFQLTRNQALFILHFYEVDENGDFVYNEGVRRLGKGAGKTPFAAVMSLVELLGPVRFHAFDDRVPGGCVGKPVSGAWVQLVATTEAQTENTMRYIRLVLAQKNCRLKQDYQLDFGKTYIDSPNGAKLERLTSSASSAEGKQASFIIADETEHWTPNNGGPELYAVCGRNLAKTANTRMLQTSNAWEPGSGSVAEATWDNWVAQEEGAKHDEDKRVLYDAVIAPGNTSLSADTMPGEVSLQEALEWVYADCPWSLKALPNIKADIWKTSTPESDSWKFYLNRPMTSDNSWCPPHVFMRNHDADRFLARGESIVMFFDGSKSNDYSALVACSLEDGHVFTLGVWKPEKRNRLIDVHAVDSAVRSAFERYDVVAFWADVREWESFVKVSWAEEYRDRLTVWAEPHGKPPEPIAWDMRTKGYKFAEATEQCLGEIEDGVFTHDGHPDLVRAVANARVKEFKGRWIIKKETPKSPNKIDAAVCMIGARMLYRIVVSSKEWLKRSRSTSWSFGFD